MRTNGKLIFTMILWLHVGLSECCVHGARRLSCISTMNFRILRDMGRSHCYFVASLASLSKTPSTDVVQLHTYYILFESGCLCVSECEYCLCNFFGLYIQAVHEADCSLPPSSSTIDSCAFQVGIATFFAITFTGLCSSVQFIQVHVAVCVFVCIRFCWL